MKLLESKELPKLKVSASGRVLHMNLSARKALKDLEIGQDVFDIIDADAIRKLSMYKRRLEIFETAYSKFPIALIRVTEKSRAKSIEITLYPSKTLETDIIDNAKKVMGLYSERNTPNVDTCIDVFESLSFIFDELSKRKELFGLNTVIENEENFFAKLGEPQAELLFLTTALIASEISSSGELEIKISKGRVEAFLKARDMCVANSINDLLYAYPQLASRLLLIDTLCEDEFIKVIVAKTADSFKLIYEIPEGKENELVVKLERVNARERISAFIDTLSDKNTKSAN